MSMRIVAVAVGGLLAAVSSSAALADQAAPVATAAPAQAAPTALSPPMTQAEAPKTSVHLPEGTQVRVRFEEPISSATAATGDTFSISTDEEIRLADGTVLPVGYRGKGEVTAAEKNGMLGKAGQLSVRLTYVKIGGLRVRVRATKGAEGASGVTSTVVLTALFGPLGLIKHGHNVVIQKGQTLTAYVDEDIDLPLPIAAPPKED